MASLVSAITKPVGEILGGAMTDLGIGNQQAVQAQNPITPEQLAQAQLQQQAGMTNQQNFLNALQAQNGLGNQSSVFNQLQGVANGTGPNPAQAQLANATGANIAAQSALMAGQRGSSSNPALIARQAAMQGANTQQQAAGQGAALQAQQSLNALNQLGGLANQQVSNQMGATNAYTQAAQNNQQNLLGNYNQIALGNSGALNAANAANSQARNQTIGNVLGGAGAAMGLPKGAPGKAEGGMIEAPKGPRSRVGQHFQGIAMPSSVPAIALAQGGPVPAMVSPGEKYLSPEKVSEVKQGANPMSIGKEIPGKPKVGGAKNSYANDTVPATLEEGGIVIPRSVTQSKDAEKKAIAFVKAVMAKQGLKK